LDLTLVDMTKSLGSSQMRQISSKLVISLMFIQRGIRPKSLCREYSDILFPRNLTPES